MLFWGKRCRGRATYIHLPDIDSQRHDACKGIVNISKIGAASNHSCLLRFPARNRPPPAHTRYWAGAGNPAHQDDGGVNPSMRMYVMMLP